MFSNCYTDTKPVTRTLYGHIEVTLREMKIEDDVVWEASTSNLMYNSISDYGETMEEAYKLFKESVDILDNDIIDGLFELRHKPPKYDEDRPKGTKCWKNRYLNKNNRLIRKFLEQDRNLEKYGSIFPQKESCHLSTKSEYMTDECFYTIRVSKRFKKYGRYGYFRNYIKGKRG